MGADDPLLRIRGLSKTFPGQQALADVNLDIAAGEIRALVGQNGSGKSTLIKILAGYHEPDPGAELRVRGKLADLRAANAPWRHNFHFIHQDLGLVDALDSVENLSLGRGYHTGFLGRIRWQDERRRAESVLSHFGMHFDINVPVGRLTAGERTGLAIVRGLQDIDDRAVLVLDEPTASLSKPEIDRLFGILQGIAAKRAAIIFVSHRLEEILQIADRVSILRDGKLVDTRDRDELDQVSLARLIAGRPMEQLYVNPPAIGRNTVLSIRDIVGHRLAGLSFDLRESEILGITGILGSGREELPDLLCGVTPLLAGSIQVGGKTRVHRTPREAIAAGIAMVPADRVGRGAVLTLSVRENVTLPHLRPFWRHGRLHRRAETREVESWIRKVQLKPSEPDHAFATLSGGNQQKVVLAKWLRVKPRVLVLDEPTQGVDVGAKASIFNLIADAARRGTGVILCSGEAEDLARVCDRVIVLCDGKSVAELEGTDLTEHRIVIESLKGLPAAASDGPAKKPAQ